MQASEDFRPLLWTMVSLGVVASLILAAGVVTILRFAPAGQHSGMRARVSGIYRYNTHTGQIDGAPNTHFPRDQPFAARVEWNRLPAGMVVAARWYDSLDSEVGGVGPEPAGQLASQEALVPVLTPPSLHANLPGNYTLVILRYSGGRPVEEIGAVRVAVLHDP